MLKNKYRENGAVGALLDEYEKSIHELKNLIQDFNHETLVTIVDHETSDEDCRSVQTILSHVLSAGYNYAGMIRKSQGEEPEQRPKVTLSSALDYCKAIDEMFQYNVRLFNDYPDLEMEEHEEAKKIKARWGQSFDVDQLMEHAIVHILRHRRQIERFLLKLNHGL